MYQIAIVSFALRHRRCFSKQDIYLTWGDAGMPARQERE